MYIKKKIISELLFIPFVLLPFVSLWNYENGTVDKLILVLTALILVGMMILNDCITKKTVLFLAINLLSMATTLLFRSGIGIAILILNILFAAIIFNNIIVSKNLYIFIHLIIAVLLFVYLLTIDYKYKYRGIVTDLNLNNINVNTVAILSLAAMMHWSCFACGLKINKVVQVLLVLVGLATGGYIVFLTGCRSVQLASVMFSMLMLLVKKPLSHRMFKYIVAGIFLISLLFPLLYLVLYKVAGDVVILGKKLYTGRQIVWGSVFQFIETYPMFGSGNDYLIQTVHEGYTQSTHNMLLGIWKAFGIVPTISVIFGLIRKDIKCTSAVVERVPQLALVSSLWIGFFESFLLDSKIYLFFIPFLLCNVKMEIGEN